MIDTISPTICRTALGGRMGGLSGWRSWRVRNAGLSTRFPVAGAH